MFPVVKRPLNFGFCFDNLNLLFIASIILKPMLCLLFSELVLDFLVQQKVTLFN